MAFVVTLRDNVPPRRTDSLPWTGARLQEAAAQAGPFATIQTFNFSDPDPDPNNPKARTFTSELAQIENGWYRIQWFDATNDTRNTDPVQYYPLPGFAPTMPEVAALVRARTKTRGGAEAGIFTTETRPTAAQVDEIIADAADEVAQIVGASPSTLIFNKARRMASLLAAIHVELSYWPEQIERGNSPARTLMDLYDRKKEEVYKVLYPDDPGQVDPTAEETFPRYAFPANKGGLAGWGTRW